MLCGVPTPTKYVRCPPLPVYAFFQCCAVSPPHLFHSSRRYVQCPPFQYKFFFAVSPPCNSVPLPHLALSSILSKVENLASSSLQDGASDWVFHSKLLGPSLIKSSWTCISECGTPSWDCFSLKFILFKKKFWSENNFWTPKKFWVQKHLWFAKKVLGTKMILGKIFLLSLALVVFLTWVLWTPNPLNSAKSQWVVYVSKGLFRLNTKSPIQWRPL